MAHALEFRAPGHPLPLASLLARAGVAPDAASAQRLLARGSLTLGGRPARSLERDVGAGELVRLTGVEARLELPLPDPARGHLVLVPAPPWWRGLLALPGAARTGEGSGAGSGEGSGEGSVEGSGAGNGAGNGEATGGGWLRFERRAEQAGVALLWLVAETGDALHASTLLQALAAAGMPALGDLWHGGILVNGGLRLRAAEPGEAGGAAAGGWPTEPALSADPARRDPAEPPAWRVGAATARALRRGHPWILRDDETEDPGRHPPGALVRVVGPAAAALGLARIEGEDRIAARIWRDHSRAQGSRRAGRSTPRRDAPDDVEARVARALAARERLLSGSADSTDAVRLVHGEADGLPGVAVDRLGPLLRILVSGRACAPLTPRIADALLRHHTERAGGAPPPVIEVLHLRDAPSPRLECVRLLRGDPGLVESLLAQHGGRLVVRERGLGFLVDPGLGEPGTPRPGVGLYLDQRENRARLARFARRGGRWLNLFAHTGAFSVALLAAGAGEVTSVDLSRPYLAWLEQNLELNRAAGVDLARHRALRRDGRRYLSELGRAERFDGIVLDPPTAAAAGRRFWSVGRDLEPLVRAALGRLAPGGVMLVCRNERGAKRGLEALVIAAAHAEGVRLARSQAAGPSPDFPRLRGFPEGDSFAGVIAERS